MAYYQLPDFTVDIQSGASPLSVVFEDIKPQFTPMAHFWDFGDGDTLSLLDYQQFVPHTYMTPGTYTVSLTITGSIVPTVTKIDYITATSGVMGNKTIRFSSNSCTGVILTRRIIL
jgi:PKD repeat protein